jgi:hypothetical protein
MVDNVDGDVVDVMEGWDGGRLILPTGDCFGCEERIRAIVEHGRGELAHKRFLLKVQVPYHGIAVPAANHMDGVVVNATA